MSASMLDKQTRSDLRTSVSSVTSCSQRSVQLLNRLLQGTQDLSKSRNVEPSWAGAKNSKPPPAAKEIRPNPKNTPSDIRIHKDNECGLSEKERVHVAEEIINGVIRSLDEVYKVKTQPESQIATKSLLHPAKTRGSARRQNKDIREIPLNRVSNASCSKKSVSNRTNLHKFSIDDGIQNLAECGFIALKYLQTRTIHLIKQNKCPSLDVENGILAYLSKLVTLRCTAWVAPASKVLKQALDVRLAYLAGSHPNSNTTSENDSEDVEGYLKASLLQFKGPISDSSLLLLMINFQLLTLRSMAVSSQRICLDTLRQALCLTCPSSTFNLIMDYASLSGNKEDAALQMEQLSRLVFSICPVVASDRDDNAVNSINYPSPNECLWLQAFSYRCRIAWMYLAEHKEDINREIIKPFAKCFAAHERRLTSQTATTYFVSKQSYNLVQQGLNHHVSPSKQQDADDFGLKVIADTLFAKAVELGLEDEQKHWSSLVKKKIDNGASMAKKCADACQFAHDSLKGLAASSILQSTEIIDKILPMLQEWLDGTEKELNYAILSVIRLRNSTTYLVKSRLSEYGLQNQSRLKIMLECFYRLSIECVDFSLKYMGANQLNLEGLELIQHNVRPSIECILWYYSALKGRGIDEDDCQSHHALKSCIQLLQVAQREFPPAKQTDTAEGHRSIPLAVHLSQACSELYLKTKQSCSNSSTQLLQMSCDILLEELPRNQIKGNLLLKLDTLARRYQTLGEIGSAKSTIQSLISTTFKMDIFPQDIAKTPAALSCVFEQNANTKLLGGAIQLLIEIEARQESVFDQTPSFCDDEGLDAYQRGLLLEWQLQVLAGWNTSKTLWQYALSVLSKLAHILLAIYEATEWYVQRLRVSLQILNSAIDMPGCFEESVLRIAEDNALDMATSSRFDIIPFFHHLKSSLEVALYLRQHNARDIGLENALKRWFDLLETLGTWNEVIAVVGNPNGWFQQLEYLAHILEARGHRYLQLSVSRLILRARQIENKSTDEEVLRTSSTIGLNLLRLGYSQQGGIFLAKCTDRLNEQHHSLETQIEYHHAYAEYYLELGELFKCQEHLHRAEFLKADISSQSKPQRPLNPLTKVSDITRHAQFLHLKSRISLATGSYLEAFYFGVREFNLLQSAWKSLEAGGQQISKHAEPCMDTANSLARDLSQLSISASKKAISLFECAEFVDGPRFWLLLPRLCHAAIHLSHVSHCGGSYQDSRYFLDQVQKMAEQGKSSQLVAQIVLLKGDFECRRGDFECAWKLLERAIHIQSSEETTRDSIRIHQSVGYFHHLKQDWISEIREYDKAEAILQDLIHNNHLTEFSKHFTKHESGARDQEKISPDAQPMKKQVGAQAVTRSMQRLEAPEVRTNSSVGKNFDQGVLFSMLKENLHHLRARSMLQGGDIASLEDMLSGRDEAVLTNPSVEYQILRSRLLIHKASKTVSSDSIFSLLTESAVSLPATAQMHSDDILDTPRSFEDSRGRNVLSKSVKPLRRIPSHSDAVEVFAAMLQQAIRLLFSNNLSNGPLSTIFTLRQKGCLLGTSSLLLAAIQSGTCKGHFNPTSAFLLTDLPQCLSTIREQHIAQVDWMFRQQSSQQKLQNHELVSTRSVFKDGYHHFHNEFINCLPPAWNVVSINLDAENNHLHITKFRRRNQPFALRLPLARQNSEDPDEEHFTFEEARSELAEIVGLSDATVHAAREDPDMFRKKGAKSQWWSEREALDERMRDLLLNLENIWLGGFRGIFSQFSVPQDLLNCFQKSFDLILDKHLPSRRGFKGPTASNKVRLDNQVFELFLGLAHSMDSLDESEEELTDLLYFVVDILQFNGESNAYDEIDFDSVIIEIQDALKSYKNSYSTSKVSTLPEHTILILDKKLHPFPWESLPCFEGNSVSRVYSIVDIYERILLIQKQNGPKEDRSELLVSRSNGTYILNPSRDLDKTQNRFEKELSTLCNDGLSWKSITNRAPTESEFASALYQPRYLASGQAGQLENSFPNSRNIFLYFGHGSGAQYIRHRRIKQLRYDHQTLSEDSAMFSQDKVIKDAQTRQTQELPSCAENQSNSTLTGLSSASCNTLSPNPNVAVALLFGCSSASLADNLEFEPQGTPKSYMLAGAPSLLGSLWDVTDGDIDKFAGGVLERWGLFEKGAFEDIRASSTSKHRGKGKAKMKEKESTHDPREAQNAGSRLTMSLTNAVAKSRGDCYLKYLNGAAMVVYGIPTCLEPW